MKILTALSLCAFIVTGQAWAQSMPEGFAAGPVIPEFGPYAPVESDMAVPDGMEMKVAFDIAKASDGGELNKKFETVARFINMHAASGIEDDRIKPAIVVHGAAATDLLQPGPAEGADNTTRLVLALLEQDVPIYLCGQSAAAKGIAKDELIPGIQVALSAMTAHAVLAEKGYSLNPF